MFSLALSPIITLSFHSCVLKCKSSRPAAWQVMFLALISISEVKGRHDIFCPAVTTVTYMLPVQDGTLLRGPPSLSSKLIMNQSVWNIYGCPPTPPPSPFLAWGQLDYPRWPLLSESGKPLALSCQYSSVDLQLRQVRLLFPHMLICIRQHVWEMACWLPLLLVPKPTVASLPLSFSTLFFSRGKGFLIPGMPEKGPLRITLAKPLSLQEIHCLLKKVVGVENQGEVLFFLSFSLFPWKVITGLKKSPFLALKFSRNCISYFLFLLLFFFQTAGGILEVENVKAGAWERGREGRFREGCAHWEAMLNIQGKCLLF